MFIMRETKLQQTLQMTVDAKLELIGRICRSKAHADPIREIMNVCRAGQPKIVCLCGSTRFLEAFQQANLRESLAGKIVLSIACTTRSDEDLLAAGLLTPAAKRQLDELHKHKINLADEVLILNVGGYIGQSTRSEIAYATSLPKPISYFEKPARRIPSRSTISR